EFVGIEWRIGGDHNHAGAAAGLDPIHVQVLVVVATKFLAHRHAVNGQDTREIRLYQHADDVAARLNGQVARSRTDAALEPEGGRPCPRAYRTFFNRARCSRAQGFKKVLAAQRALAHITEPAVVGLSDDRVY